MAAIYLIRHGEPTISGVLLGRMDPPLSEIGRRQSEAALSAIEVEVAWTSSLQRAKETAVYLRANRVIEMADLQEIDQGEWTGRTWSDIEEHWGQLASSKMSDWLGTPAPGGETWDFFLTRVSRAWNVIRTGPTPAAIVGHQGVNAALAQLIDGRDPLKFSQKYAEVMRIEYD